MAMERLGRWCKIFLLSVIIELQPLCILSQEPLDRHDAVLRVMNVLNGEIEAEDNSASYEQMAQYFEYLLDNPVSVNSAGRGELERLILLSDFQIESIMDYRGRAGVISSAAELSLLYGFDKEFVDLLAPFISFMPRNDIFSAAHAVDAYVRISGDIEKDTTYIGAPLGLQIKCKYRYSKNIEAGLNLQSDIGEHIFRKGYKFMDFYSGYLAVRDYKWLKSLVVGDFSARFGYGSVLWKAFLLNMLAEPKYMGRSGIGIAPYTSSDENNFFRGIAASCSFGRVELSSLFSCNKLDARVSGDYYTSLPTDGLHNTYNTLSSRKKMGEKVAGVDFSYLFPNLKVGFTAVAYCYDKKNGRKIREDNKYRMYDGLWGNIAINFNTFIKRTRIFGEAAFDYGGSEAFLVGLASPLFPQCDLGVLVRHYSKSYIAPHASAFSTLSEVANQDGITVSGVYIFGNALKLGINTDAVYYPWKRYNIDEKTWQVKGSALLEHKSELWDWRVKVSEKYTSHNSLHRLCFKGDVWYRPWNAMQIKTSVAAVYSRDLGYMSGVSVKYGLKGNNIVLQGGGYYFNCDSWNARLYSYESDLPYTYSSRLLYGEGGCFYILVKCKIAEGLEYYLKGDALCYAPSSENHTASDNKTGVKMAVKYRF